MPHLQIQDEVKKGVNKDQWQKEKQMLYYVLNNGRGKKLAKINCGNYGEPSNNYAMSLQKLVLKKPSNK